MDQLSHRGRISHKQSMVNIRQRISRRHVVENHRYQPFARIERPPKHPQTAPRLRKADSRDDDDNNRRTSNLRDFDDSGGYSSDGSVNTLSGRDYRNNDPITVVTVSLKQSLKLQKEKLGLEHPSVTKAIHSLALEYKMQGKLNKSVRLLKEGIDILDLRLSTLKNKLQDECNDDDSLCRQSEVVSLLEEKSTLYSCLGNIFRMRKLYREAMDYYVKSGDMLVEAGYRGESKRVSMMVRIMRRTEIERINKPPVRANLPTIEKVNLAALR
jgi:hypothetical protein